MRSLGVLAAAVAGAVALRFSALEGGEVMLLRARWGWRDRVVGLVADTSRSRAVRLVCDAS